MSVLALRCARVGLGARAWGTVEGVGVRRVGLGVQRGVMRRGHDVGRRRWASSGGATTAPTAVEGVKVNDTQLPPPPSRPLTIRLPIALALTLLSFGLGFTLTGSPSFPYLSHLSHPPTDASTLTYTPPNPTAAAIESQIQSHPLTQSLLSNPAYIPSRPHLKIPAGLRTQNLVAGILSSSPEGIAVPPLQFSTADGSTYVQLTHLGPALCGHPGIVHGGVLATLLDEGLARCCFPALPNKVAVTAWLRVEYKKPVQAGQVIVLRAETTKVEGRKAWVKGTIETLPEEAGARGQVLAQAEALFVEPRQAKHMRRVVA